MTVWLTISKALDRSKNKVPFHLPFSIFSGILSTSSTFIAVLALPFIVGIVCNVAFYAQGLRVCTSDGPPQGSKGFHVSEKHTMIR